jgi:ATP-dependent protease ClpP protease subunit
LAALPDEVKTIRVMVNSVGGSVFDAQQIHTELVRQREELGREVVVEIEALAASAATLVTSAGSPIRMPRNALMFVHNPLLLTVGNAKQLREDADMLDKVKTSMLAAYRKVSKLTAGKISALMDVGTWMDADEAKRNGFVTEVSGAVKATATLTADALEQLGEIPAEYRDRVEAMLASRPPLPVRVAQRAGATVRTVAARVPRIDVAAVYRRINGGRVEEPAEPASDIARETPAPPRAPARSRDEGRAHARAVLSMCRRAGFPEMAEQFIESDAPVAAVRAAIDRAKAIKRVCAAEGFEELATSYINSSSMSVDAVRAQLLIARSAWDDGQPPKKSGLNVRDVYGDLNKAVNEKFADRSDGGIAGAAARARNRGLYPDDDEPN